MQSQTVNVYEKSDEFAVVAFWDLNVDKVSQVSNQKKDEQNKFICTRFFCIPNPKKRTIQDSDGTELHQVLYTSTHTNDIFFFFEG